MLALSNVSKRFGGLDVLQGVNLRVPDNCIFGLIGPNGAGKTTVFNLITGLLRPTAGSVAFNGQQIAGQKPYQIARQGIARTFQNIRLFREMTLLENVVVGMHRHLQYGPAALFFGLSSFRASEKHARERALELLSWVKLEDKAGEIAANLSYGNQRKLELARALASAPKLLLLDEPVAGMNPAEKAELMEEISAIKERGYAVFMIEHDMTFVMGLCEKISVLNFGRIIAEGRPTEIKENPQVIEAYLGRETDADDSTAGGTLS